MVEEEIAFKNILKTSDAVSLVHHLVDFFIGQHEEENFCAVVIVGRDEKILAQAVAPDCSEHNAHIALVQARAAVRGVDVLGIDRVNGKGQIRGHFGGATLVEKGFFVGFYIRHMTAKRFVEIIKEVSLKID